MLSVRSTLLLQPLWLNSGFCLLFFFVIWLFFKLQSPFLCDCPLGQFNGFLLTLYFSSRCPVFSHAGMGKKKKRVVCLLERTAGQYLTCCALSVVVVVCTHSCAFCLLPSETSGWSLLLVQCAPPTAN